MELKRAFEYRKFPAHEFFFCGRAEFMGMIGPNTADSPQFFVNCDVKDDPDGQAVRTPEDEKYAIIALMADGQRRCVFVAMPEAQMALLGLERADKDHYVSATIRLHEGPIKFGHTRRLGELYFTDGSGGTLSIARVDVVSVMRRSVLQRTAPLSDYTLVC